MTDTTTGAADLKSAASDPHAALAELTHKIVDVTHARIAAMEKSHASFSYAALAVVAALVGLMAVGGYLSLKHFDSELARAEARDARYEQDRQAWQKQYATDQAQIVGISRQQVVIASGAQKRNTAVEQKIAEVTNPTRTSAQVVADFTAAYKIVPTVTPTGVELTPPDLQTVTATKLDRDRLNANLGDITDLLGLEKQKTAVLAADVQKQQGLLKQCEDDKNTFKAVAKKSKLRRILDGAKTAGEIGLAAFIGYEVGHRL